MKPPSPLFAPGHQTGICPCLGSRASADAAFQDSDVRLVVERIRNPASRGDVTLGIGARLLTVASEHLRHVGPSRFTLRAVANELEMARASVYRHFRSKVALLDAVVERWLRDVEAELTRIADAPDPAEDKIEHLLTALAIIQREAMVHEPNLFATHVSATVRTRYVAKRHRVRLRSLVERVVEEGIASGAFATRDRERAIAYIFDASYRFTHPLAIQQDADLPRDLLEMRLGAVILTIQTVLRTGSV